MEREVNIEADLQKIWCDIVDWIQLAQVSVKRWAFLNIVICSFGFYKKRKRLAE